MLTLARRSVQRFVAVSACALCCCCHNKYLARSFLTATTTHVRPSRLLATLTTEFSFFYRPRRQQRVAFMASSNAADLSSSSKKSLSLAHHNDHVFVNITDVMWTEYCTLMQDIMTRDRVLKKIKADLVPPVQAYLLDRQFNEAAATPNLATMAAASTTSGTDFRTACQERFETFVDSKALNDKPQTEYLQRCLGYMADWCAKKQLKTPAVVAWCKVREVGLVPRENTVSTFLYVVSSEDDNDNGNDNATIDSNDFLQAVTADVATFHDLCYAPNEKTVFLRIKSLIASGDAIAAEQLLQDMSNPSLQRLRTYTPLLQHYCASEAEDSTSQCLRIFRGMRQAPGVHLDVDTYVLLLCTLAERGYFSETETTSAPTTADVAADSVMVQAGFPKRGPALLDAVATEMADDLLEWNLTAAVTVYNSFRKAFGSPSDKDGSSTSLDTIPPATKTENFSPSVTLGRVTIDASTSKCPVTDTTLRLFALTSEQRTRVHQTLLDMACTQHEEFSEKMRHRNKRTRLTVASEASKGEYALEQLSIFANWVARQNFTAIVDGPNIAYFGHPVLHYSQVERMVRHLESLGERPLVTMPHKYCQPYFYLASINKSQQLTERDQQVIANLQEKGQFYMVPEWCLDDYYWMIASVVAHASDHSTSKYEDSSLPGLRPLLITNDQMRDHKLTLLEPRLFRRWTSCHIVRYDFAQYNDDVDGEWAEDREVRLEPADSFSREIQGNPMPTSTGATSTAWHIPIAEWSEDNPDDRFCIAIKSSSEI